MSRGVRMALLALLVLHGLVHLMGFAAYWPLAEVQGLPYKTTLLGGLLQLNPGAMRAFGALWLVSAVGYLLTVALAVLRRRAWRTVLLATTLFSLVLTVLDYSAAFMGVLLNLVILAALGTGRIPDDPLARARRS